VGKTIDLTKPPPAKSTIHYPESDGQPMGETDFHISVILYLRQALRYFFRQAEQIYVAANMFLYYEEENPNACKAPDVFVVKGVSKHDRRIYKLWEEKAVPCTVFEITSYSTRLDDLATKRGLYEMLGVAEYFLFDPLAEYLSPRLQGFQLAKGYYQPMTLSPEETLFSQELGVTLKPEGVLLRVVDPVTEEVMPTLDEAIEQTRTAKAELARLRAELERLRRKSAKD
jgi:Uma2 family endonuclease